MSETETQRVERLAEEAVEKGVRRGFTITKFSRHEDGYLHARVTPSGSRPIYVHARFGSWMAPGTQRGQGMLKELEALMKPELAREAKMELSRKARSLERRERGAPNGNEGGTDDDPGGEADV